MLILSFLPPRLEVASLTVLVLVIGTVWILKEKLIQTFTAPLGQTDDDPFHIRRSFKIIQCILLVVLLILANWILTFGII